MEKNTPENVAPGDPGGLNVLERQRARRALEGVSESLAAGAVEGTDVQRAYIDGAAEALRWLDGTDGETTSCT